MSKLRRIILAVILLAALLLLVLVPLERKYGDINMAVIRNQPVLVTVILTAEPGAVSTPGYCGYTPLHWAAATGNTYVASQLLAHGADVNATAEFGDTPLHTAILCSQPTMVRFLITHGADLFKEGGGGATPVVCATQHGEPEALEVLLQAGAPIPKPVLGQGNPFQTMADPMRDFAGVQRVLRKHDISTVPSAEGSNATIFDAVRETGVSLAYYLRKPGAVEMRDSDGRTPLHAAVESSNLAAVKALLAYGANVNARDSQGRTPLYLAFNSCHCCGEGEITDLLLRYGASLSVRDKQGLTPTDAAALANDRQGTRQLEAHGGRITSIFAAASVSDLPILLRMLRSDPGLAKKRDADGDYPLNLVSGPDAASAAAVLIARGAAVNARGHCGQTALDSAAERDNVELVRALLDAGADINAKDKDGATPLLDALQDAESCDFKMARLLIKRGADVNLRGTYGKTPIEQAAQVGAVDIVKLLLAKGARVQPAKTALNDLFVPYDTCNGRDWGLERRHRQAADLLIAHGAEVNAKDAGGNTPLHTAAEFGRANAVAYFISKGADVNATNTMHQTPLDLATNPAMIVLLLRHGAVP